MGGLGGFIKKNKKTKNKQNPDERTERLWVFKAGDYELKTNKQKCNNNSNNNNKFPGTCKERGWMCEPRVCNFFGTQDIMALAAVFIPRFLLPPSQQPRPLDLTRGNTRGSLRPRFQNINCYIHQVAVMKCFFARHHFCRL